MTTVNEREYVIPLRRHWLHVQQYNRSAKAIQAIKKFVAKHMKVADRDISKVKLDVHFNNEIWFRGRTNPPAKIKVKVKRDGDLVKVDFVDTPEYVKHLKNKSVKYHKHAEKAQPSVTPAQITEAEKNKELATAENNAKEIKEEKTAAKHTTPIKESASEKKSSIKK